MALERIPRINVLGTQVAALNLDTAVVQICEWLADEATGRFVCVIDVHCIMQSLRRPEVRRAYRSASLCVPDGMPLTWVGRSHGYRSMRRVYGPDLMLRLLEISATSGFTNYLLGGEEGVAEKLRDQMMQQFPGLNVVGTSCPPFRPLTEQEKRDIINEVDHHRPDLLWVGLGAPKQDLFMAEFHTAMQCKVMIGVGAAFDIHTGRVRQAPRWMMWMGLEWLFRLFMEPRRLAPRYFKNIPAFVWHLFLQESGARRYPLE